MLKKLLAISVLVLLMFAFFGCKKTADNKVSNEAAAKSTAEYQAEAKSQINKDNMSSELDKLEKSIEADAGTEQ